MEVYPNIPHQLYTNHKEQNSVNIAISCLLLENITPVPWCPLNELAQVGKGETMQEE